MRSTLTVAASLVALSATLAAAAPLPPSFVARHGQGWELGLDPASGRPRRLVGGAARWWPAGERPDADVVRARVPTLARSFLRDAAGILDLRPEDFRLADDGVVVSAGARVVAVHLEHAPGGVPVDGGRVTLAVVRGSLVGVHVVGAEPVAADPDPAFDGPRALELAIAAAGLEPDRILAPDAARLTFLRLPAGHLLAWQVELVERAWPHRWLVELDARTGAVISLTDQAVSACEPLGPGGSARRVLGGVRPERADEPERTELLPLVRVGESASGIDGLFPPPPPTYGAALAGPAVRVDCADCAAPADPWADADPSGEIDFGSGGADEIGNGRATPADRVGLFHVEGVRRQAARWLSLEYLETPLRVRTNLDAECNAFYDGRGLNFFRSSDRCSNSGEIRDVVAHEWGHGLDHRDGLPSSRLDVDAATGEAVADVVAILRSRDPCVGESFYLPRALWPSDTCSGVRDADEWAPGHERGSPGTLSTGNVAASCPPSGFYRGPLGREGHCEGEIFGQAFWHLVQNLRTGRSHADGSDLGSEPLTEEQAWQVAERLFYTSRALLASYAPSHLQAIGMSAHEAFLLADDEGDGIAGGTPHAAAIGEAFAHHGLTEVGLAPPDTPDCTPPPDPAAAIAATADAASGLPALTLTWSDVGAESYHVLRADAPGDGFLPLTPQGGTADRVLMDRGVLPGRTYEYVVLAEDAGGCTSPGEDAVAATAGVPLLRIDAVRVDDTAGGDGDGRLAEGETALLEVDLRNAGSAPVTGLDVSLGFTDPALVVLGPASLAYADLPAGGFGSAPGAFEVRVDTGASRSLFLVVTAESDQGCLRDERVLEVASRDLRLAGHAVDDPLGDGDSHWEPGETAELAVDLRDEGLLDADAVDGTISLRAPVPGVAVVDDTASWGLVPAGGPPVRTQSPHFALSADATVPPRTAVPLWLDVRIGGAPHRRFPLDLTVGAFAPGELEWSFDAQETWGTPVVAALTDDDGDGRATACDVPAVVILGRDLDGFTGVFALRGDGSGELWRWTVPDCAAPAGPCSLPQWALGAGDVDGDGAIEIVHCGQDRRVTALTAEGSIDWISPVIDSASQPAPQVWDLDADGTPEVVVGSTVLDGTDGTVEWSALGHGRSLVVDLDLDGRQEVIVDGGRTFRADGSLHPALFPGFERHGGAVDLDDDPEPEIVYLHDVSSVSAREHDGALRWRRDDLPGNVDSPPGCMGDLDGDGRAEIVFPTAEHLWALDDDGTDLWTTPRPRSGGIFPGCTLFDFDDDGWLEVTYRGQGFLAVLDGRSGEVLWETDATSSTLYEIPVIADADGDGSAEIVMNFTSLDDFRAPRQLHVFGSPAWAPARAIWNQEAYSVTHVTDDGAIPSSPVPRWSTANDFKAQSGPCACGVAAPSFAHVVPECSVPTACFDLAGDAEPNLTHSWDFGDGSPEVVGESPCHAYPGPGDYLVMLTQTDPLGCVLVAARTVTLATELAVEVAVDPDCPGRPWCFTAIVTGGVPPFDVAWEFGDGSPQGEGETTCHVMPDSPPPVTAFVRDANACLAETTLDLQGLVRPASVGSVLLATGHGDPHAPQAIADFAWTGDLGAPRPADAHYHLYRSSDPANLTFVSDPEPLVDARWTDATPAARAWPHVHHYRVHAADPCERESED